MLCCTVLYCTDVYSLNFEIWFKRAVSALLLYARLLTSGLLKRHRNSFWIILPGTEHGIALNQKFILQSLNFIKWQSVRMRLRLKLYISTCDAWWPMYIKLPEDGPTSLRCLKLFRKTCQLAFSEQRHYLFNLWFYILWSGFSIIADTHLLKTRRIYPVSTVVR